MRRRSVREDTHTLYTSVMSLPILAEGALADGATMKVVSVPYGSRETTRSGA